jgi:fucose permease
MSNIPPEILAAQAAGRIPTGESLEYLAESRDGPAKAAIVFVGCVAFVTMIGRFYSRIWLVKKLGLDDYLAFFTLVFCSPYILFSLQCDKMVQHVLVLRSQK